MDGIRETGSRYSSNRSFPGFTIEANPMPISIWLSRQEVAYLWVRSSNVFSNFSSRVRIFIGKCNWKSEIKNWGCLQGNIIMKLGTTLAGEREK